MSYVQQNTIIGQRLDVSDVGHVVTQFQGQLLTDDGDKSIALDVGSNGQALTADSSTTSGLLWKTLTAADVGISAGDGLNNTAGVFSVIGSDTIYVDASGVAVNSNSTAGQPLLSSGTADTPAVYGSLALNNSNAVTNTLPVTNGGTGSNSYALGSKLIASNVGGTALVETAIDPADLVTISAVAKTSDATPESILTYLTVIDTSYNIKATIIARDDNTPFDTAVFNVEVTLNNDAGTIAIIGGINLSYVPLSTLWKVDVDHTGNSVNFNITGSAATNITWKIRVNSIVSVNVNSV